MSIEYNLLEFPDELWINEILVYMDEWDLYVNFRLVSKKAFSLTFVSFRTVPYDMIDLIPEKIISKMYNITHIDCGILNDNHYNKHNDGRTL